MLLARQFYTVVSIPFFASMAFAGALTYQYAALSSEGAALMADWQRTARLNQELAAGNAEQSEQLRRQLEAVDPGFPEAARALHNHLSDRYTEYLRVDIDIRERLVVERVRGLQDELSIETMHVYEPLRAGNRAAAAERLHRVYQLEGQVRDEFERLSAMQMDRLQAVMAHLEATADRGRVAVLVLIGGLVLTIVGSGLVVRRRVIGPVRQLLEASDRMAQGNLSARVTPVAGDELGQLAGRFNAMADALLASHTTLERRVEERTTQVRDMQQRLAQAEKMSALGVMVSGVAHELNNPLAVIMGFAEMARAGLQADDRGARAAGLLEDIQGQVDRCRRIVAGLLDFARYQEPTREVFALNDAVEQVVALRDYEMTTRNMTIVRQLDPSDPRVRADRNQVQQVVLNLLNNARDAVSGTGRPGRIWVRTRGGDGGVVLEVEDEGPGFADPGRAFDPFYTTKDAGKGTGLGLSVCERIVREHGGEITAANGDLGARVTVLLPSGAEGGTTAAAREAVSPREAPAPPEALPPREPASSAEPAPPPASVPPPAPHAPEGPRALVVDDEPALLRLHRAFLSRLGISSTAVASGEDAIRHLSEHAVDIVISDVRMPGAVDGVKLYEWVARNRPDLCARFIFVSGDLVGMNLDEFFQRIQAPRITKPFRFEDYKRAVADLAAGGRVTP